jgi:hypothetical protein
MLWQNDWQIDVDLAQFWKFRNIDYLKGRYDSYMSYTDAVFYIST